MHVSHTLFQLLGLSGSRSTCEDWRCPPAALLDVALLCAMFPEGIGLGVHRDPSAGGLASCGWGSLARKR